jgi:hypothetical protein
MILAVFKLKSVKKYQEWNFLNDILNDARIKKSNDSSPLRVLP